MVVNAAAHKRAPAGGDGGEVKKIYLLQPLDKLGIGNSLKGGGGSFVGPQVQNHIHIPSATVKRHTHASSLYNNQRSQQSDYEAPESGQSEGGYGSQQQQQHQHSPEPIARMSYDASPNFQQSNGFNQQQQLNKRDSDLKILPIVVIPPVAPMPPIQMQHQQQQQQQQHEASQHGGRGLMLTPQVNNYVMQGSNEDGKRSIDGNYAAQDQRAFADYGGSVGGAFFRTPAVRGLLSARSRRPLRGNYDSHIGGMQSASSFARHRGDTDSELARDAESHWRHEQRMRRQGDIVNAHVRHPQNLILRRIRPRGPLRANSIRDAIDQSSLFDDDVTSGPGPLFELASDARLSRARISPTSDCCSDDSASNGQPHEDYSASASQHTEQMAPMDSPPIAAEQQQQLARLHREAAMWSRQADHSRAAVRDYDDRVQRDAMHAGNYDDEWRYESVKSVTHSDAPTNTSSTSPKQPAASTTTQPSTIPAAFIDTDHTTVAPKNSTTLAQ